MATTTKNRFEARLNRTKSPKSMSNSQKAPTDTVTDSDLKEFERLKALLKARPRVKDVGIGNAGGLVLKNCNGRSKDASGKSANLWGVQFAELCEPSFMLKVIERFRELPDEQLDRMESYHFEFVEDMEAMLNHYGEQQ